MTTPLPSEPRRGQELPALTSLRAIAAALVFIYHFAPKGLPYLLGVVVGQGHVGVTVFFVLSGFLITVRYYPQFAGGKGGWGAYFVRRAARILPLYFVVLTLTYLFSIGSVPVGGGHLRDWTLTHALFGPSLDGITVLTSWSLTVEECFYASAPLVFLAVAALRRRLRVGAGAVIGLAAASLGFYLVGSLLLRTAPASLPFLSDGPLLRSFTIFGRFPDFALGAAAGLLFLSGRVERAWARRRGAFLSTAMALTGGALIVAGQAGMVRAAAIRGGEWGWNLLVAAAAAAVILALTCPRGPLSRLLAWRPAVYLGRVSYALYLIQLTPLGSSFLFRILPGREGVHLLLLYAAMNAIAALLFELVEEPAREAVLALWRERSLAALAPARTRSAAALSLAIMLVGLGAQYTLWVTGRLPAITEALTLEVLGPDSPYVVRATVEDEGAEDHEPRVWLPTSWWLGSRGDRQAPRALLVFVDGQRVPFLGVRPSPGPDAYAYYKRPRTEYLSLAVDPPAAVTVVDEAPLVVLALARSRLAQRALLLSAPLLLLGGLALAAMRSRRPEVWSPRNSLALGMGLVSLWLVGGLHRQWWAPLVLLLELAVLAWLVLSPRAIARREPARAPEDDLSAGFGGG